MNFNNFSTEMMVFFKKLRDLNKYFVLFSLNCRLGYNSGLQNSCIYLQSNHFMNRLRRLFAQNLKKISQIGSNRIDPFRPYQTDNKSYFFKV